MKDFEVAVLTMKNKTVLGCDGILAEVHKLLSHHCPVLLFGTFNALLKAGIFPFYSKVLALIRKDK